MHLAPSLINTITAWLRNNSIGDLYIFSMLHVFSFVQRKKLSVGWTQSRSSSLSKQQGHTVCGKKEQRVFDTAITAVKCGRHKFDGWMTENLSCYWWKIENHHEERAHSVLVSKGLSLATTAKWNKLEVLCFSFVFLKFCFAVKVTNSVR